MNDCSRCGGTKYLAHFRHVEGGRCFLCGRELPRQLEEAVVVTPKPLVKSRPPLVIRFGDSSESINAKLYGESANKSFEALFDEPTKPRKPFGVPTPFKRKDKAELLAAIFSPSAYDNKPVRVSKPKRSGAIDFDEFYPDDNDGCGGYDDFTDDTGAD